MKKKKTLNIDVKNCCAVYTGTLENPEKPEPLVCGNPFNLAFTFDEEWDGYDKKKAKLKFYHNGRYEDIKIKFSGNTCPVPALFNIQSLEVGVFIDDDICTTTGAVIECKKSIRCGASKSVLGADAIDNINKALLAYNDGSYARIGEVTLPSSEWIGSENLYSQVVNINGVTENTQVDLTPSVQQLAAFYEKDLAFVTENEGGVVTVYCIGQKPQNDYIIQVTMTEVLS